MLQMTPAEQARAEVEAWFTRDLGMTPYGSWNAYLDRLISRLTPVFERAQAAEAEHAKMLLADLRRAEMRHERDALRERAERAEAKIKELEWDGALNVAEADVKRLREALEWYAKSKHWRRTISGYCDADMDGGRRADEALAATEPKELTS